MCAVCHQWSLHDEWYHEDEPAVTDEREKSVVV